MVIEIICAVTFMMDLPEALLVRNRDWDPAYLSEIFDVDFNDYSGLVNTSITDMELVKHVEKYCPIVEDISLDNETLCKAVTDIENE